MMSITEQIARALAAHDLSVIRREGGPEFPGWDRLTRQSQQDYLAQAQAVVEAIGLIDTLDHVDALTTERDQLRATVDRVRALADNAATVNVHAGGGNLVRAERLVSRAELRAALNGDNE